MDFEVRHEEGNKYYAVIDGSEAAVGYLEVDDETLDFQHTYVPEELRGQGVAEKLVRHALDDAKRRGFRVLPSCPYVKRFVERHPEYQQGPGLTEAPSGKSGLRFPAPGRGRPPRGPPGR